MRKISLMLICFMLALSVNALAASRMVLITASTADSAYLSVLGTEIVYSKAIPVRDFDDMNVIYKAYSTGTVNLKLELERGYDLPSTEYAEDSNYVISANDLLSASITDQQSHMASPDTVQMPYIRFKCTGLSGNDPNNTRITIKIGAK